MIARSYWRRLKLGSAVKDWIGVVCVVMELIDRLYQAVRSEYCTRCRLKSVTMLCDMTDLLPGDPSYAPSDFPPRTTEYSSKS